jgi:uncharacterized membrane protein HdeD (DUF308 family)
MKRISRKKRFAVRRVLGLGAIVLGLLVLLAPIFTGRWIIGILGIALIAGGLFQFFQLVWFTDQKSSSASHITGVLSILLGLVLFLSPHMALTALVAVISLVILIDGLSRIWAACKQTGPERKWNLFSGLFMIALALLVWWFVSANLGLVAIGVALGLRLLVEGWTMIFLPERSFEQPDQTPDLRLHPDGKLGLEPNDAIKSVQEAVLKRDPVRTGNSVVLCLYFLGIFFAIHVLRTDAHWSFLGLISPFSAVIGDAIMALIIGVALILPLRLLWRKMTRPVERIVWRHFVRADTKKGELTLIDKGIRFWLESRMRFALGLKQARYSFNYSFWWMMLIGLPLTAIFIAINSIWGFSWYFNSENWASAVWQEITKARVDTWRLRAAEEVEKDSVAKGIRSDRVFFIEPEGISDGGDFSFIVIGDTGEGDPSQMSLHDQLIAASQRENVKFLVLSSDVIYPDGKMKDYETNFYLPFKGFKKPIYAIPGNHDWYDADEGFNANFFEHAAAIISLRARLAADVKTDLITTNKRFDEMVAEAKRLREYYRIQNGGQRAPFFELHKPGFSLIAVDTGIMRTIDEKERSWLEAALQRAGDNFKLVVLGHPFYVGGKDSAADDKPFNDIHELLRRYEVDVAMAGDTHDFEFYREKYPSTDGEREMLHFVNGGGGAYLSVGTAADFPKQPITSDYAFYPRTDELKKKIQKETPAWKLPFWWWMEYFGGYPFDSEMVSGAFDFNRAPFFQSFLEVSVEPSQNRVRFLLYGVNGRLRWRDIQIGGDVKPVGSSDDDFVEFSLAIRHRHKPVENANEGGPQASPTRR